MPTFDVSPVLRRHASRLVHLARRFGSGGACAQAVQAASTYTNVDDQEGTLAALEQTIAGLDSAAAGSGDHEALCGTLSMIVCFSAQASVWKQTPDHYVRLRKQISRWLSCAPPGTPRPLLPHGADCLAFTQAVMGGMYVMAGFASLHAQLRAGWQEAVGGLPVTAPGFLAVWSNTQTAWFTQQHSPVDRRVMEECANSAHAMGVYMQRWVPRGHVYMVACDLRSQGLLPPYPPSSGEDAATHQEREIARARLVALLAKMPVAEPSELALYCMPRHHVLALVLSGDWERALAYNSLHLEQCRTCTHMGGVASNMRWLRALALLVAASGRTPHPAIPEAWAKVQPDAMRDARARVVERFGEPRDPCADPLGALQHALKLLETGAQLARQKGQTLEELRCVTTRCHVLLRVLTAAHDAVDGLHEGKELCSAPSAVAAAHAALAALRIGSLEVAARALWTRELRAGLWGEQGVVQLCAVLAVRSQCESEEVGLAWLREGATPAELCGAVDAACKALQGDRPRDVLARAVAEQYPDAAGAVALLDVVRGVALARPE